MDCPLETVRRWLKRHGLETKKTITEAELKPYVDEGMSSYKIAKYFGVSSSAIRYWLKQHGMKTTAFRKCKFCGEQDVAKFEKRLITMCRACKSSIRVETLRQRKKDAIAYRGGKCFKCGYDKCPAALDFHHRDRDQKPLDWKVIRHHCLSKIKEELDKCDLLCKNCHAEYHYEEYLNG